MNIQQRIQTYQKIEDFRKRPLIVYAASTRQGVPGLMAGDAVREIIDQVDKIPLTEKKIDILLHSSGGDGLTAWKLMSVLRERFDSVCVMVPYMAFSAATLFTLGADEIVMHPHASLGPIDPQITVRESSGAEKKFGYEDVTAFMKFISEDVKLSEQQFTVEMVKSLCKEASPLTIGYSKRASSLAEDVGERMLKLHMDDDKDVNNGAKKIARDLNRGFFAHGDAVSRSRARKLNLKIAEDNQDLENLIWTAFLEIETHMELRKPFNPLQVFLADTDAAKQLQPTPSVKFPPNATQDVINAIWNPIVQQILQNNANGGKEVSFSNLHAIIESTRIASECKTTGTVFAHRGPDGGIQTTITPRHSMWEGVAIPG